jgi:nucleotide-binding universal stress UspA family protein
LSTHAADGLERLFLGSFAETALMRSKVPLYVVNPKNPPAQKVKTIFFPTDLSPASRKTFGTLLAHAKRLKAKVVLYQKLVLPVQPLLSAGSLLIGGAPIQMEIFAQEQALKSDREADQWVAQGKAAGVKVEWVLDKKVGTVKEGILRTARAKKAQLIALSSSAGMIEAALVGSVARQVVREARCPVWVVHA